MKTLSHAASDNRHSAFDSRNLAPGSRHSELGTRNSALGTRHLPPDSSPAISLIEVSPFHGSNPSAMPCSLSSFQSPSGSLTALIGRNGSGKSTLLRSIAGLHKNYSGSILLFGKDIRDLSPAQLSKTVAFVNTRRPNLPSIKCYDLVALGRSPHTGWNGKLSPNDHQIVKEALEAVGMSGFASRRFNTLSDGESQKIMIARAIAQDTPVILLDEPTSFLDIPNRHEVVSLLRALTDKGRTIIFSTHELDIAKKYAHNILNLSPSFTSNP